MIKPIKQISSGGFIFHHSTESDSDFVLLIKNHKDEWWIPKGKLEKDEDHISAAFREINEEVGFAREQLEYVGFCDLFFYLPNLDDGTPVDKQLYFHIFNAKEKYFPHPNDWHNLKAAEWFSFEDALNLISFTKDKLVKSHDMFKNFLKNK